MPVRRFKICTKRPSKDGEKNYWPEVGTLFYDVKEDRFNITLNMMPNEHFYCFDTEKKEEGKGGAPF